MFSRECLTKLKASKTVLSMTPKDLRDMEKAFGFNPERVDNKKVQSLTGKDLLTLESLFHDYRIEIIANFQGLSKDTLSKLTRGAALACACCSCSSCQNEPRPLDEHPF